jgi:hypothetical protein
MCVGRCQRLSVYLTLSLILNSVYSAELLPLLFAEYGKPAKLSLIPVDAFNPDNYYEDVGGLDIQSFNARDRHHRLPQERRYAGARPNDGRTLCPRTTNLYDRRNDETALDEYEKVRI